MSETPAFARYRWAGGEEWMMRMGPADGPVAVLALPLFEEANRTRALAAGVMRALAGRGIGAVLPELPGQGESLEPTECVTLARLREAYAAAAAALAAQGGRCFGVAIRSGALLERHALLHGRWQLAPQEGASLVRELTRVKQAETGQAHRLGERWWHEPHPIEGTPLSVAGNLVAPDVLTEIALAEASAGALPRRVVRLAGDPRPADRLLPGTPPWRRAEPTADLALSQLLADDIAGWVATCEGR